MAEQPTIPSLRLVFMGTPDFAVPSLEALAPSPHQVVGVVTAPDRPAGRGRQLRSSAVKQAAQRLGMPVAQPDKLRDPAFHAQLRAWAPDLLVVVAFRMLPEVVWSLPPLGALNLHASLLPDYRGAAPINWVLMQGETRTGLTTFLLDRQIDTGDLLLQEEQHIPPDWNAGQLHDALMQRGADLVRRTVDGLAAGSLSPQPQNPRLARHTAPKLTPEVRLLDWRRPAQQVYNHIRGLAPYPAALALYDSQEIKVYGARLTGEALPQGVQPGLLAVGPQRSLRAACADQWLELLELQQQGRKRMDAASFLNGFPDFTQKSFANPT